jgi:hypothetical protein
MSDWAQGLGEGEQVSHPWSSDSQSACSEFFHSKKITNLQIFIRECMEVFWITSSCKPVRYYPRFGIFLLPWICWRQVWNIGIYNIYIYIYIYIFTLPQLLYRWRHQVGIFWIVVVYIYKYTGCPRGIIYIYIYNTNLKNILACCLHLYSSCGSAKHR